MYLYVLKIEEAPGGISIEGMNLNAQHIKPTELERKLAGCLDIGLRLVQEAIMQELRKGACIEGKNIEQFVGEQLKKIGAFNLHSAIEKAGYTLEE